MTTEGADVDNHKPTIKHVVTTQETGNGK